MTSSFCKECKKEPRIGPLQSRCHRCIKHRAKSKEMAKKERIKIKRQKHKERPAALKKKLDIIFSKYIRLRDKGKPCVTCGCQWEEGFNCGHFQSRRFFATRWDERNAHGQCARDNLWGAGEQYLHSIAVDGLYGQGVAQELFKIAHDPNFKLNSDFLKERLEYFAKKLAEIGGTV